MGTRTRANRVDRAPRTQQHTDQPRHRQEAGLRHGKAAAGIGRRPDDDREQDVGAHGQDAGDLVVGRGRVVNHAAANVRTDLRVQRESP